MCGLRCGWIGWSMVSGSLATPVLSWFCVRCGGGGLFTVAFRRWSRRLRGGCWAVVGDDAQVFTDHPHVAEAPPADPCAYVPLRRQAEPGQQVQPGVGVRGGLRPRLELIEA